MSSKKSVVVLGCGKIGRLVTFLLARSGAYQVTAVDQSMEHVQHALELPTGEKLKNVEGKAVAFDDKVLLTQIVSGKDYVVSCAPFHCNVGIAEVCRETNTHYLDLTEDVATTKAVKQLAAGSSVAFIPQCGLAPGFISIVANNLAKEFDTLDTVKMRVGALPMYPHNKLKYNLTWSTEGLINEYCNPCEAVVDGKLQLLQPLEGLENLSIDGVEYEAFNTSGGLGTLAETFAGELRSLDYKSMRYPGHREILQLLLVDLKLNEDQPTMCRIFENALPYTLQDVVVIYVTVKGMKKGRLYQTSYVQKVYSREMEGVHWGAIQITTAAGICGVLNLHAQGKIPQSGFVKQEDVPFKLFMEDQFGKLYG